MPWLCYCTPSPTSAQHPPERRQSRALLRAGRAGEKEARGRQRARGSCCSKGSGDGSGCVFICVPANLKLVLLLVSVSRKLVESEEGKGRGGGLAAIATMTPYCYNTFHDPASISKRIGNTGWQRRRRRWRLTSRRG